MLAKTCYPPIVGSQNFMGQNNLIATFQPRLLISMDSNKPKLTMGKLT